jgi:hypothetical protein
MKAKISTLHYCFGYPYLESCTKIKQLIEKTLVEFLAIENLIEYMIFSTSNSKAHFLAI